MEKSFGAGGTIQSLLEQAYKDYRTVDEGKVATYIPELGRANPDHFGVCVATVEGKTFEVGDCDQEFTMQSISKILVYALALSLHGEKEVSLRVGVEPSGDAFNSIQLDKKNRAFNPICLLYTSPSPRD